MQIIVDTSAWIEFFADRNQVVVNKLNLFLNEETVGLGDLIYCEVLQGLRHPREREHIMQLFAPLERHEMLGFNMAEKAAANYRLLRTNGITPRKTIDVIIGTFCAENGLRLLQHDRDFELMAPHIGLELA